jgi:hypothetical protein
MTLNYIFKTFWWVLDLLDHCILNIAQSDNIAVGFIFLFSFFSTLLSVESRFVKIDIITHCDTLSRDEELK